MRTLSLDLLTSMYAEETDRVVICLIELSHPSWAETAYLSSNPTTLVTTDPVYYKTTSNGIDYDYVPFTIMMPDDTDEAAPSARFAIENISRDLVARIRSIDPRQGRPKMTIKLVTTNDLNFVEVEYPEFDVIAAGFNDSMITVEAQIDAMTEVEYPAYNFDPAGFPALHGLPN